MMPRPSSALLQAAIRSIETGSAEATPTAEPAFLGERFELDQRAVDFGRGRHRVDGEIGLGEGHRLAGRQRGATLRGAEPSSR